MDKLLSRLSALIAPQGVSGREGDIAAQIEKEAAPFADVVKKDVLGNLLVRKKGPGKKVLVSAHMDTIGFVATYISEAGMIRVGGIGGVSPKALLHHTLRFEGGAQGVLCRSQKPDSKSALTVSDLYVDIGARDKAEAEDKVSIGETASFVGAPYLAGGRVVSPYLDNRLGCLVLLMAMEQMTACPNDVTFAFTVQEEVGMRGVKGVAFDTEPYLGLTIDGTATVNIDAPEASRGTAVLGGGAGIKRMDRGVICDNGVIRLLEETAKGRGIPAQVDILQAARTEAGIVQSSRGGVLVGGISIPLRHVHTPGEMADLNDISACANLLAAVLEEKL